jgi:negative regulator of flagellin synthesis FlgM
VKVDASTNSNLSALSNALSRPQQSDAASAANTSASSAQNAAAQAAPSRSGDSSVNLSGVSQQMRGLAASDSSDIDTAHVESIKQAIKNGTLQIDSGKIADGVLQTARDLLQNKNSSTGK